LLECTERRNHVANLTEILEAITVDIATV